MRPGCRGPCTCSAEACEMEQFAFAVPLGGAGDGNKYHGPGRQRANLETGLWMGCEDRSLV